MLGRFEDGLDRAVELGDPGVGEVGCFVDFGCEVGACFLCSGQDMVDIGIESFADGVGALEDFVECVVCLGAGVFNACIEFGKLPFDFGREFGELKGVLGARFDCLLGPCLSFLCFGLGLGDGLVDACLGAGEPIFDELVDLGGEFL